MSGRPGRAHDRLAVPAVSALCSLAVVALVWPSIGSADEKKRPSLKQCAVTEISLSLAEIPLHLPYANPKIEEFRTFSQRIAEDASDISDVYDWSVLSREIAADPKEAARAQNVRPPLGQDCYTKQIDWIRKWVAGLDTATPDTAPFFATLADGLREGWDARFNCRAFEKGGQGLTELQDWITQVDDKIDRLNELRSRLELLRRAANDLSGQLAKSSELVLNLAGFGGGLVAWYSSIEQLGLSEYFRTELVPAVDDVIGEINTKTQAAWKVRDALEADQKKLDEQQQALIRHHRVLDCNSAMDQIVEEKNKHDRDLIMDEMVAAKLARDQNAGNDGGGGGGGDAFGQFLGGFVEGLGAVMGGMGGGGYPPLGSGGGADPRCGQALAQMNANRNWLNQVNPSTSAQHRSAANAVRQGYDQTADWYNQNCR